MLDAVQPQGLSVLDACKFLGVGKTTLYEAIKQGRLKVRKLGKRTIIVRADLEEFLASLPTSPVS